MIIRWMLMLVMASLVSVAMLVLIVGRTISDASLPAIWLKMLASGDRVALFLKDVFGTVPAAWVMRVAATWDSINPWHYWWLPVLVIVVSLVLGRISRRRTRR